MAETASEIEKILCHGCHAILDVEDKFCRHCGRPTGRGQPEPASSKPAQPPPHKWADNPWMMTLMLFAVLGPLALPALWRGKAFGRRGKIAMTIALAVASVLVVWLCVILLQPVIESYKEVFRLMDEMRH
jgi:hypothetical protein